MEEWKDGGVEGWKDGGFEGWKGWGVEGCLARFFHKPSGLFFLSVFSLLKVRLSRAASQAALQRDNLTSALACEIVGLAPPVNGPFTISYPAFVSLMRKLACPVPIFLRSISSSHPSFQSSIPPSTPRRRALLRVPTLFTPTVMRVIAIVDHRVQQWD
jgi:hypothetical protein